MDGFYDPGDIHKMIAACDGDWNEEITMWMDPAAPPTKSTAMCTNSMIMDGRYQQSIHKGDFNGMPFHGMSIWGYNNARKMFRKYMDRQHGNRRYVHGRRMG